jgi:pimeloyl-ACP methyl ester carboxylesterase
MTRILYLHGFASGPSSSKAQYFREHLERAGAQVEVPDLPAGDFEHLTITGQLAVIGQAAGSGSISLMGSSMGGYLAALYAARHPEVEKLVLMAPGFGFARRWPEWIGAAAMQKWRQDGVLQVFHYGEHAQRNLSYGLIDDAMGYEDYPDFQQPALIFHGEHDDVVPPQLARDFADAHANVQLELLDSGHDLLNVVDYLRERIIPFFGL